MKNIYWLVEENLENRVVFLNLEFLSEEIVFSEVKCWAMWYLTFPGTGSSRVLRGDLLRLFLEHSVFCLPFPKRRGESVTPFGDSELRSFCPPCSSHWQSDHWEGICPSRDSSTLTLFPQLFSVFKVLIFGIYLAFPNCRKSCLAMIYYILRGMDALRTMLKTSFWCCV